MAGLRVWLIEGGIGQSETWSVVVPPIFPCQFDLKAVGNFLPEEVDSQRTDECGDSAEDKPACLHDSVPFRGRHCPFILRFDGPSSSDVPSIEIPLDVCFFWGIADSISPADASISRLKYRLNRYQTQEG